VLGRPCRGRDFPGEVRALFALHPIQTETVVWISACPDILVSTFLVLSLYFYNVRKEPISLVSVLFAALAVFTKETGIAAPALIFAYEWIHSRFKNAVLAIFPCKIALSPLI
jgi:protein O-mannosyl-transferase